MIYLIKTSYYDEKTCKPMFLLKIGYAKNIDDRIKTYKTHNPLVQLLDTREGDYELENYLHMYFSEYAYPNQSEWFYYNERIIQEFKTVEIKPLLSDILMCIKKLFTTSVSFMRLKERYIKKFGESEFNKSKEFIFNAWLEYSKWMNSIELEIDGNTNNLEYNTIIQVNNIPFDIKTIKFSINQILGRQCLDENPWKNSAELYVTLKYNENSKKDFKNYLETKLRKTESLLKAYTLLPDEDKDALVEKYERDAKNANYKTDFVAVNHHAGSMAVPVKNDLMMISEMRTFEIQEYDYKDRFSVFSNLSNFNVSTNKDKFDKILNDFNYKYKTFRDRMKFICDQKDILEESGFELLINSIPMEYKNYIITLGVERIKAGSYTKAKIEADYQKNIIEQSNKDSINSLIYSKFNIGDRISNISLKASIQDIYNQVGNNRTAKAEDINQWFEVKAIQYRENGKKVNGIKIINKK